VYFHFDRVVALIDDSTVCKEHHNLLLHLSRFQCLLRSVLPIDDTAQDSANDLEGTSKMSDRLEWRKRLQIAE
jgi:hypothetical protein